MVSGNLNRIILIGSATSVVCFDREGF